MVNYAAECLQDIKKEIENLKISHEKTVSFYQEENDRLKNILTKLGVYNKYKIQE